MLVYINLTKNDVKDEEKSFMFLLLRQIYDILANEISGLSLTSVLIYGSTLN